MTQTPEQWAKEHSARARVEAAAPKMLAALKYALPALESLGNAEYGPIERVRAAIAEAEGPKRNLTAEAMKDTHMPKWPAEGK